MITLDHGFGLVTRFAHLLEDSRGCVVSA